MPRAFSRSLPKLFLLVSLPVFISDAFLFFLLGGWKTFPGSFFLLSTTFFLGLSNFNAVLFRRGDPGGKLVSVTLRYPDSYNLDLAPSFEAIFVFESHGKFARNVEVN